MKISKQSFTINTDDLEGRLDPLFYISIKNIQKDIVDKARYDTIELIRACSINRGRFGHRPRNDPKFYNGKYPFIQTGDIVKASENNTSIKYTQTLNELGLKTSKLFQPPKLLFTIAANIGDTALLDYPSCFPDSIVALIPKNDDLLIEYLNIYLKLIKRYIVDLAPYSAQKNLNNQQLAQIPLVIPPKEIQTKIIQIMDNAYKIKKEKEEKAKILLDSIDTYLLEKLDITLPKEEKVVSFEVSSSDVFGGRFDPLKYNKNYINKHIEIEKSKYITTKLKKLVINSSGGNWGDDEKKIDNFKNYQECLVIRSTEFDNQQNLNINTKRRVFRFIKKSSLKNLKIKENDILIEKSGGSPNQPVGRVAILIKSILHENSICYSNFIHKISLIEDVKAHYIFNFLKTIHNSKVTENMQSQTNGIRNLIMKEFLSLKIPLPPLNIQNEIASHIQALRDEAKQLKQEAKEVLKKAKDEVEGILFH